MAEYVRVPEADWQDICDAVRGKTGETAQMVSGEVAGKIDGIESGGGGEWNTVDIATGAAPSGEIRLDGVKFRRYAFAECQGVTKATITNCDLAEGIFYGCNALTYADVSGRGNGQTGYTFRNCTNLVYAKFNTYGTPSGIFYNCSALERADLGEDWYYIGVFFATNCNNLKELVLRNTTRVVDFANNNALNGTPIASGEGYIYVPDDMVEAYKTNSKWANFVNQFKPLSELPEMVIDEHPTVQVPAEQATDDISDAEALAIILEGE